MCLFLVVSFEGRQHSRGRAAPQANALDGGGESEAASPAQTAKAWTANPVPAAGRKPSRAGRSKNGGSGVPVMFLARPLPVCLGRLGRHMVYGQTAAEPQMKNGRGC